MTLSIKANSAEGGKLEALRRLDQFREWSSLEDKRYCLCCGKIIDGRQISVTDGEEGAGSLRLRCPSEGCGSIPMDWVLPTDEVLSKKSILSDDGKLAPA
jgi:hypothetical protein